MALRLPSQAVLPQSSKSKYSSSTVDYRTGEQAPHKHRHPESHSSCYIKEWGKLPHLVEVLEVDVPPQGEHRTDGEFQAHWVLCSAWNKPSVHSFHRNVWVLIKSSCWHCRLESWEGPAQSWSIFLAQAPPNARHYVSRKWKILKLWFNQGKTETGRDSGTRT